MSSGVYLDLPVYRAFCSFFLFFFLNICLIHASLKSRSDETLGLRISAFQLFSNVYDFAARAIPNLSHAFTIARQRCSFRKPRNGSLYSHELVHLTAAGGDVDQFKLVTNILDCLEKD